MRRGLINPQTPEQTALVTEDGRTLSYSALVADVGRVAALLEPRDVIFILGRNDYPSILFYLASLERGTVPLILGAETRADHVAQLRNLFSPHLIFADSSFAAGQEALTPLAQEDGYTLFRNEASLHPKLHRDLAFLAATSGSTGSPKLVRLSLANLTANAASIAEYLDIGPGDRAAASLPLSYSYGLSIVNSHLYSGASLVLSNRSLMEQAYWQQMRDNAVTSFAGVPYHYEMLLRLRLERLHLPSLRKMTQAGGRLAPGNITNVHRVCQDLGIRFWTMYGQTEASPRISYLPPEDTLRKLGSIGRAIPGGRLWISDESGADITRSGRVGELVYEGPNVCLGYAHSADDLALGDDNRGVLRTGDLARCDEDGYFYLEGRLHRFLKIHGKRISLDQIERAVAEKGLECVARGMDDHLVVQVVDAPGLDIGLLRHEVADFSGIHFTAVSVVTIPELPRLPTGKVDYQCLARKLQAG